MLSGLEVDGTIHKITDEIIEGATVLLNKIGPVIEDKITKLEKEAKSKPEKATKNQETIDKF